MMNDSKDAMLQEANSLYRAGKWAEAMYLYSQLAEAVRVDCQLFIGELLSFGGNGIEQDYGRTDTWLKTAAKAGHPKAFYALGVNHYKQGDYSGSIDNLVRAGELGYAPGHYRAGTMHHEGFEVEKNIQKALYYYSLAASMGQVFAKKYRALLLMKGHKRVLFRAVGFFSYISLGFYAFWQAYRDSSSEKLYR